MSRWKTIQITHCMGVQFVIDGSMERGELRDGKAETDTLIGAVFRYTSLRKTLRGIDIISKRLVYDRTAMILTLSTCAVIRTRRCF